MSKKFLVALALPILALAACSSSTTGSVTDNTAPAEETTTDDAAADNAATGDEEPTVDAAADVQVQGQ